LTSLSISEISGAGMTLERKRLEAATMKLAQANIAYTSATEAMNSANKLINSEFKNMVAGGNLVNQVNPEPQIKTVYDPNHPLANGQGNVYFVDIDPIQEMATLVSAVRAYEANVRAYNTSGAINKAALSIGGNK
jgi:flagellar basal-body rod protein FlgC